jgi:MoxR-like ATPase
MGYPEGDSERQILRAQAGAAKLEELKPVLSAEEVQRMQAEVEKVRVDESLVDYALEIVKRTRESQQFALGVSPRGSLMLYRAAQALAYLNGRNFATPDDFKTLVVPVFAHRIVVDARYGSTRKSEQAEKLLSEIIETVPVPQ